MQRLGQIMILVTASGHPHTQIYLDDTKPALFLFFWAMTNPGRYESSSIWQYEFMLPRVLCSVCSTVSVASVLCHDLTTHRWEKVSQLAWSAYWAQRCTWSPQGCPWKKAQSTVGTLEDGLNTGWESNLSSPGARAQKKKHSLRCSWFIIAAAYAISEMCVTKEKMVKNQAHSPLQLQNVNNSMQYERSFWCCTADCTAIQLFINPFFHFHPAPPFSFMLCLSALGETGKLASWS